MKQREHNNNGSKFIQLMNKCAK